MRWLLVIAAASALVVGGCGSSSAAKEPSTAATTQASPQPPSTTVPTSTKPSRKYSKADLVRIVLQAKDSPADMRYLKIESGQKTLAEIGFIAPSQFKEARSYGFRAVRDAVFAARSPQSDRRVSERVWLMKNASEASGWLQKSKDDSSRLGFTELPPSGLGDESWAAEGQVNGAIVITHAFRLGNAVVVVTTYGAKEPLSPAAARAAAAAALARARKA